MSRNVVDWFEIPVNDMSRAKTFYSTVFGKDLVDMNMPEMEMAAFPWFNESENAPGSLVKSKGYVPTDTGTVVYFYSDDVSVELAKAVKNGGKVIISKTDIGEYGYIALFTDCEGNRIGLHSAK